MNSKRLATLAAPLLIAAAAAAPAQAVVGGPTTTIKAKPLPEGTAPIVVAKINCPTFRSCQYHFMADSGTALEGTDFTATDRRRRVPRNRNTTIKLRIVVAADGLCEANETVKLRLEGIGEGDDDYFVDEKTLLIPDRDCVAPQPPAPAPAPPAPAPPAPAPAPPAPAPPADSGTPTETTMQLTNGIQKECRTPYWVGQKGAYGAQGFYNSGCTVKVTCPVTVRTCQAHGEGANNSEVNRDERVSLNSRLRVFSASNTEFWFRDQSCTGASWCRTEDAVMVRGGESISNQCNGVRAAVDQPNRTAVRCTISLEYVG